MKTKVVFFEVNNFEKRRIPREIKKAGLKIDYILIPDELTKENVHLAKGASVVSVFIYSKLDSELVKALAKMGVKLITTRSTGFNHIDLNACRKNKIVVSNVPCYGATTVAEHTFALILTISRKINEALARTKCGDFSLKGLRGFDLEGKTIGVIGTGRIGREVVRIARGFNMKVICYDIFKNPQVEKVAKYVDLDTLLSKSDIVTLHLPLLKDTRHILNSNNLNNIKKGAVLINTARGELIETRALINALDSGRISFAGLDVLEAETLFKDKEMIEKASSKNLEELKTALLNLDLIKRQNVIVTPHNAFNTEEAATRIIRTTLNNVSSFMQGNPINKVN